MDIKQPLNHKITFLPFQVTVEAPSGSSLLEAVKAAHLPLNTTCGEKGTCGGCIVRILSGKHQQKQTAALSDDLRSEGFVLACQTSVSSDMQILLPQFEEKSISCLTDNILEDKKAENISGVIRLDPLVKKLSIKLPPPSLKNNYSDLKRLERELNKRADIQNPEYEFSVLKKLAAAARANQGRITLVIFRSQEQDTIIAIEPAAARKKILGIACDIGTTTVALYIVDLEEGKILGTAASVNQQIKCGEDIISRIEYARKPGRLQELQSLIIGTINQLIKKASENTAVSVQDIYSASFTGNTTMLHLLLNCNPAYIREEPYVPTFNRVPMIKSRDIGLNIHPEARVFCAPAVGSYVGGDITAGLLSTPILLDTQDISLFIDAGTNGELVVGNHDWLMTCACSTGPAFEGGGIQCGMPAMDGAIESITLENNGQVNYQVIGRIKPKGICGSGLVDLMAELFTQDYIDRHGKFIAHKIQDRLIEREEGKGFLIEAGNRTFWGNDLFITENDISHLIRTKAAVFAASSLLLKQVGLEFKDIQFVYLAGGFGQNLNIENAIRIGLLPDLERDRFSYIGNSSLLGAYLILLCEENRKIVHALADKMTYMELNTEPAYMNEYTGAMFLPHTDMKLFPTVKQK